MLRSEDIDSLDRPGRAKYHCLCTVHNKSAVAKYTVAVSDHVDSKMIRLALAVRNHQQGNAELTEEARELICEQLVVILGAELPAADAAHRDAVYELYLSERTAREKRKSAFARSLLNGSIKVVGVVQHYCSGCCKPVRHTKYLFLTEGVSALLSQTPVIDRTDWCGTYGSHITRPSFVASLSGCGS